MMKIVQFNIDPMDLQKIERMIRDSGAITTIWSVDQFDRYSLGAYVKETVVEENKFSAMLDQNMFSRIIGIAKNKGKKPYSSQQKTACALLAFLQLAEVTIVPNHAVFEIMDSEGYGEAIDKLSLFRAFDNLDSQILIDLALGRRNEIPDSMLKRQAVESIEQKKGEDFRHWRNLRRFVLKLAIIDLQRGSLDEKFERFLDWVYKESFFINTAIIFGLVLFSEKRFQGMLKDIGSGDKGKVLKGVRNATWDMAIAYYWCERAMAEKGKGVIWLLCTEDNALRTFAGSLVVTGDELEKKKKVLFCKCLGDKNGNRIFDKLVDMDKRRDYDSSRRAYNLGDVSNLYPDVDKLEKELLEVITLKNRSNVF